MKSDIELRKMRNEAERELRKMLKGVDCFSYSIDNGEMHFETFCSYSLTLFFWPTSSEKDMVDSKLELCDYCHDNEERCEKFLAECKDILASKSKEDAA